MAKGKGHAIQWPKLKDIHTMAKRKGHTIQWPKEKDTQYNGQK